MVNMKKCKQYEQKMTICSSLFNQQGTNHTVNRKQKTVMEPFLSKMVALRSLQRRNAASHHVMGGAQQNRLGTAVQKWYISGNPLY